MFLCSDTQNVSATVLSGGDQSIPLRNELHMSTHAVAIDDDQAILDLYRLALEEEGYTVTTHLMAFEHVQGIAELKPSLIILDLKMGKENVGILLLEQLRMYRPTKDIPVLICTAALRDICEQEDVLREKGIPVAYKPFDLNEFLLLVKKIVTPQFTE